MTDYRVGNFTRTSGSADIPGCGTFLKASLDGRFCFVSSRKSDTVSVISFDDGRELGRIKVGTYPQRMWVVAAE